MTKESGDWRIRDDSANRNPPSIEIRRRRRRCPVHKRSNEPHNLEFCLLKESTNHNKLTSKPKQFFTSASLTSCFIYTDFGFCSSMVSETVKYRNIDLITSATSHTIALWIRIEAYPVDPLPLRLFADAQSRLRNTEQS